MGVTWYDVIDECWDLGWWWDGGWSRGMNMIGQVGHVVWRRSGAAYQRAFRGAFRYPGASHVIWRHGRVVGIWKGAGLVGWSRGMNMIGQVGHVVWRRSGDDHIWASTGRLKMQVVLLTHTTYVYVCMLPLVLQIAIFMSATWSWRHIIVHKLPMVRSCGCHENGIWISYGLKTFI